MSYATIDDAKAQLGVEALLLVADRNLDGEIDVDVVTAALDDAAALIDAHISARYALPLPGPVPALLRGAAVDIAHYRLANRPGQATDDMRRRHDDALALLKRIAEGKAELPGLPAAAGGGDDAAGPAAIFIAGSDVPMFGRRLRG